MGKYASLEADVYSVFGTVTWKAENILTLPDNFEGSNKGSEWIRVSILPSGTLEGSTSLYSVKGLVMIDIFTPAGGTPKRASQIADKLDTYLAGKVLVTGQGGSTQFFTSTLMRHGLDDDNPSLFHCTYTIPFSYFGKQT